MAIKAGCGGSFDGICCRMVIETKRVFDGCAFADENITLNLTTTDAIPVGAQFESARVTGSEFVGYTVERGEGGCSHICGEIVTVFAVTYSYGGALTTVRAVYRETKSVLLRLPPSASLIPYDIEVRAHFTLGSGAIIGGNAVSVTGCFLQVIKVTADVDILIPTYGYCKYPPCTGCTCRGDLAAMFPSFNDE